MSLKNKTLEIFFVRRKTVYKKNTWLRCPSREKSFCFCVWRNYCRRLETINKLPVLRWNFVAFGKLFWRYFRGTSIGVIALILEIWLKSIYKVQIEQWFHYVKNVQNNCQILFLTFMNVEHINRLVFFCCTTKRQRATDEAMSYSLILFFNLWLLDVNWGMSGVNIVCWLQWCQVREIFKMFSISKKVLKFRRFRIRLIHIKRKINKN